MPVELEIAYARFMRKAFHLAMMQGIPVAPIYILRKDIGNDAVFKITCIPSEFTGDGYEIVKEERFGR